MKQVIFQQYRPDGRVFWLCGRDPVREICADRPDEVLAALADAQSAADRGLYVAGYIAYEAAGGLDSHFAVYPSTGMPLVWLGVFEHLTEEATPPDAGGQCSLGDWTPSVSVEQYRRAIGRIKEYIAAGDTYQVNYTMRLRADFAGEPMALFHRLCAAQRAQYCAYVDTGRWAICSASPELFFEWEGGRIVSRPMKGTAPRGMTPAQDKCNRQGLIDSAKDRAENAMIVDMMRNDLGQIARPGSVTVGSAFDIEKYPTVFQMTSTVQADTPAGFVDIVKAMFPCASITGAPKVRTMEIIRQLEPQPRGVYCGAVGYLGPGRRARFNVAIRTATIDRQAGRAEYGVGGGIVWDSQADKEYAECQAKAAVLSVNSPEFQLLETILYRGAEGYWLLDEHLVRLGQSAEYFDFAADVPAIRRRLEQQAAEFGQTGRRVRLLVARSGEVTIESAPYVAAGADKVWRLGLAAGPVSSQDVFLYHKTTFRDVYQAAAKARGDCDDALLWNEHGQVTEMTIANVVVELDGRLVTPPVDCGLLGGVFRGHLLRTGQVHEAIVTLDDLKRAGRVFAVNSIRGWMPAIVVPG